MEYNKSLSARIKRHNKQGFKGEGNHKMFSSVSGDYTSMTQNYRCYKYLDKDPYHINLVNRAKKLGLRHAGSKTVRQLKRFY